MWTSYFQSFYGWDDKPSYGLGDYRIPKVALTDIDGNRIPIGDVAQMRGKIIKGFPQNFFPNHGLKLCQVLHEHTIMEL